ncbi:hypothetical protein HMPREF9440_01311 [Sutterella parvirubra YIT 11816]|uniref:Uncharacterized protein n=1 Tax=Sutterella parvirubra YIT 11816 TaxID=762967 RepID=H3KEZ6_9BURK|nr:hypothetical protein HMPREF9440_01311 [Sutterella parvirubra YIT 11816]
MKTFARIPLPLDFGASRRAKSPGRFAKIFGLWPSGPNHRNE